MKQLICVLLLAGSLAAHAQQSPVPFRRTFTSQVELGALLGRVVYGQVQNQSEMTEQKINLTLQFFGGRQLTPRFAVGATVGTDWYNGTLLLPLGGGVRYTLTQKTEKAVRVYTGLDAGYATNWFVNQLNGSKTTGGVFASPTIGLRMGRPDRSNFTLSLSYRYQQVGITYLPDAYYLQRSEARTYNRLAIRLGVSF